VADHNELGKRGEQIAVDHLKSKGYTILETNWRFKKAEVDIICEKENILIFTEVKTRTDNHFGNPETSVSLQKQKLLVKAAGQYLFEKKQNKEIRFDIISILLKTKSEIEHFEDAFFSRGE